MTGVKDGSGEYTAKSHDELKKFIDDAVADRIDVINQADKLRLERFALDAEKLRAARDAHFNDKPDPAFFGKSDQLREWSQKVSELEGRAQIAERQYKFLKQELENKNLDLQKRKAKRYVAEEHPAEYRAYQDSAKVLRENKLLSEWESLDEKLHQLIDGKSSQRELVATANRLSSVVSRLEKTDLYSNQATDAQKSKVDASKQKLAEISKTDLGNDREL